MREPMPCARCKPNCRPLPEMPPRGAVVRLVTSRGPVAAAEPVKRPVALAVVDAEFVPVEAPDAAEARLGAALEAMPDDMRQEALRQFLAYLASHAGGGGLTAADVQALVAEGMRDLRDHYDAHLNGQSLLTGLMARGRGMVLVGALAVAYGAEVMTSGFAFGDMIRANAVNWPLAFTSSFLFGGGLIALAPTEKQRQFWGRVGLGFALTVAGLSATNRSLVDPLRERIGTFLFSQTTADLRADAAWKQAAFEDLEKKRAEKNAAAAQDKAAYLGAKKNRPAVMDASGQAAAATEAQRDAARAAAFAAKQKSDAAEKADPANYAAAALAFVLAGTITGAGQWFIGNYLNSRIGVHAGSVAGSANAPPHVAERQAVDGTGGADGSRANASGADARRIYAPARTVGASVAGCGQSTGREGVWQDGGGITGNRD